MRRSTPATWIITLCLLGQLIVSLTSGASICFACGPTFCSGVEAAAPAATYEQSCCCKRCRDADPASPEKTPAPAKPRNCCCGDAVPMPGDHRRVEQVTTTSDLRIAIEPLALDLLSALLPQSPATHPIAPLIDPPPGTRSFQGLASTRLLI